MWHQWFNRNFTKLRELFVHKKNNNIIYSTILLPELPSSAILESIRIFIFGWTNHLSVIEVYRSVFRATLLGNKQVSKSCRCDTDLWFSINLAKVWERKLHSRFFPVCHHPSSVLLTSMERGGKSASRSGFTRQDWNLEEHVIHSR